MHPVIRNILGLLAGIVAGGLVNLGIIAISDLIIPLPEGVDPSNMESIKNSMHLYEPRHFIMPFLAHALGTLTGAFVASLVAARGKMAFALSISVIFLIGGIIMVVSLPSPLWFNVLDLVVAYIPMGWLGYALAAGMIKT